MFGDVIAIYTSADNLVAKYTYDTWGKLLSIMDANESDISSTSGIWLQNSIRYRGYVYDNETGWYYLQSRYYDPEICRFINADGLLVANNNFSINLFSYAECNPLVNIDPTGTCPYNGSMGDFRRLEMGLPSMDCNCVDITNKLDNAMDVNSQILQEYSDTHNAIDTVNFFINKVKPGGDWDFKSQQDWSLNADIQYRYNGDYIKFDDIGNIHYGYVGCVIFNPKILLIAGGVVQIYTGTSEWSFYKSNFDDPRDQEAIQFGIDLWKENNQ